MWDPETKTMTINGNEDQDLKIVRGWESDLSKIARGIDILTKEIHENSRKAHDDRIRLVRAIEELDKTLRRK